MPNWVKNVISVTDVKAISGCLTRNESGEVEYDFEKVVPMPEEIYKGNLGKEEWKKYGCDNWYDWSILNWGTKWNAHDYHRIDKYTFAISTAWSTPEPFIKALSRKYNCEVSVKYADEDIGNNCGSYTYFEGELDDEWAPDDPKKFAEDLWEYEGNEEARNDEIREYTISFAEWPQN